MTTHKADQTAAYVTTTDTFSGEAISRYDFDLKVAADESLAETVDTLGWLPSNIAAGTAPSGSVIRTSGFAAAGDGGHGDYVKVGAEPNHEAKRQSTDAQWWELVYNGVRPEQFGAKGDGSTDDSAALQDWVDYLVNSGNPNNNKVGIARGRYRVNSTVTISDPQDVSIYAWGAKFVTDNDILMFDLNGRADPTYTDNESRQIFNWFGGSFDCAFTNPTAATAIRAFGFRRAMIEPEDISGFHHGVLLAGKDTIRFANCKFFKNGIDVYFPAWSLQGGPLMVQIENIHSSHSIDPNGGGKPTTPSIKSNVPLTDCVIRDISCNLGTSSVCTAVHVRRTVMMGVATPTGTFTAGETITGGTSGATMTLDEVDTHFAFTLDAANDYRNWLVGSARSATEFVNGETVTGGTSGATAVIGTDDDYLWQDPPFSNLKVEGSNHFESGSGSSGATCITVEDIIGRGQVPVRCKVDCGSSSVNGGGAIGVQFGRVHNSEVTGRFGQTTGLGNALKFDANCVGITVNPATHFSTGGIDLNGMDRDELNLSGFNRILRRVETITGLTALDLSSGASATIVDMSANHAGNDDVGGLLPKAYSLLVGLSGTTSSSATNVRFRIYHPDEATAAKMCVSQIAGIADGVPASEQFLVGADDNGDFEYDATNAGGGTVTATVYVAAVYY